MNRIKYLLSLLSLLMLVSVTATAQTNRVEVVENADGWRMLVDGEPLMVNGMNWDYFPIGTNYEYDFWGQPASFIKNALDYEMGLLKNMGVNSIRVYTGITREWIEYIYDNYGIYTMLNHSFGRYGVMLSDGWMANTEYSDPRVQELLLREVTEMVTEFRGTRGLLLYLLGNENNYGLFWGGAETEDIPVVDRQSTVRARAMYQLFNAGALAMKEIDQDRPIAMANGDLLFMDLVVQYVPDMDIFGANVYRGETFTDLYDRVAAEYGKPVLLTEFGSDAFNARTNQEDQLMQAHYKKLNWLDIYQNAAGLGRANNSIGGYTFQWSDGWWKLGQTEDLDVHNTGASWANGGYQMDYVSGENNMNEEWFGIMAKGPTNAAGHFELFPRAAYYVLQRAHGLDVYAPGVTLQSVTDYFREINLMDAVLQARGDRSALQVERLSGIRLSRFSSEFTTFNTGGNKITTPDVADPNTRRFPNERGFDHMQSFYIGVEAQPSPNMRAEVQFNVLANVAQNPIDEIFYENRGRQLEVLTPDGMAMLQDVNRVNVYNASYSWNHRYFDLTGFYRTGRYHWGYEGDFFGLYPEANYGDQIDIYNGIAPFGFEAAGRRQFDGLKFAFGPQLWWGANPAFLLKYRYRPGPWDLAAIYHEDVAKQGQAESSFAIPQPKTRRVTLAAARDLGPLGVEAGVIWAGQPLNGREFQLYRENSDGTSNVYVDEIKPEDNWGGKVKLTFQKGNINWYAQSAVMGLVAQGGYDQTMTFTGWRLKDTGSGNQYNFLTGLALQVGNFQIAPNFLWQQPIEGPVPTGAGGASRPRNILDDPFVVRANREMMAAELLVTFDPTPATYMFDWNNDFRENSPFAISLGFVYRHLPTSQDAAIGILPDGRTTFAFPGAPPAKDLWEVHARIVSRLSPDLGMIARIYGGDAQANGSDPRTVSRFGGDLRVIYRNIMLNSFARVNDWGPYDYHRDFNLTFPLQLMADVSMSLGEQDWFNLPRTRLGVRGTYRTLDQYSPRYAPAYMTNPSGVLVPNPTAPGFGNGNEWEFRTYIQINI
jgi:hypothetical protein